MKPIIDVMIDQETLNQKISELAAKIDKDYSGKEIKLIGILKGAIFFMVELAKGLQSATVTMDFMDVSSYGASTVSSGEVRILKDLDEPIENEHVLLVEDIIDSGLTLRYIRKILTSRGPASIKICTLLNKPARRVTDVPVDYIGFTIPDEFVVGFGLDYDEKYRNLPFIGTVRGLE